MTSRPDLTDEHGVRHRYGCAMPGWRVETSQTMPTIQVWHCHECGALHIRPANKEHQ